MIGLDLPPSGVRISRVNFRPEFLDVIARRRAALRADVVALLPAPRPIVWEVGCGHGHFLVRYAAKFPERFCIGVDLRLERLARSGKKRDRARLDNCHFLRAEAREFLLALPAGVTFEEIWVLFPDPWPKARHHKNRLLQPGFFEAVAGRAGEGARFFFRTDHQDYFQEVRAILGESDAWRVDPKLPWPLDPDTVFQAKAPAYHSLAAVRTSHPARPIRVVAPGLPPPEDPRSPA